MTSPLRIAIIGGGAAGHSAAIEAKRCNHMPTLPFLKRTDLCLLKWLLQKALTCKLLGAWAKY